MADTDAGQPPGNRRSHARLVVILAAVVIGMGAFGYYALVPLYTLVCNLTGLNGRTERISPRAVNRITVDPTRWVTMHFDAHVYGGLPWSFRPLVREEKVHPGALSTVTYAVDNESDLVVTGRAVDSVVPNRAARYLKKLQCFCFTNHTLQPHEKEQMEVRYVILPDLPKDVKSLYLFYTFSQVSAKAAGPAKTP